MASEMIGEVLKLSMVVTLVAVLSISVYGFLPDERPPHLEIEMSFNHSDPGVIDITHVGGDPIQSADVHIEITNSSDMLDKIDYRVTDLTDDDFWKFPETLHINASTDSSESMDDVKIAVIHRKAIIALGEVRRV